ncbi:hypothetical protein GF420_02195 [candidate division GN15 bacterium]|nr:hypothetical protein [candidate division GN15 bacterium]
MRWIALTVMLILSASVTASEDAPENWAGVLRQMQEPSLADTALIVRDLTISHHDVEFRIDSAIFYPFAALATPDADMRLGWGGLLHGRAWFRYAPPVTIERQQLRRFYDSDSLDQFVTTAVLFFDQATRARIDSAGRPIKAELKRATLREFERHFDPLTRDEQHYFTMAALRNNVHPRVEPFLLIGVDIEDRGKTYYLFDSYLREEIHLLRSHDIPGERFIELVCRYVTDIDETYATINGVPKDQLRPLHFDIDGLIDDGGEYSGSTIGHYEVVDSNAQFIRMMLHEELELDSIRTSAGDTISFVRYDDDSHKSEDLYLLFDRPLPVGDTAAISFFYHGDIAKRKVGQYHVEAGSVWYPRYGFASRATFDLHFRTPKDLTFVVSADLVDSSTVDDTLFSDWRVTRPAANIGFNIGWFTRYDYGGDTTVPVELYYNEPLHRHILENSGRTTYREVGSDVVSSLTLFSDLFGPYRFDRLVITELVLWHGESFPGFIHMGANTFISTDHWGADHLFRSHEVAHQWWGSSLGYETYHDQWLSEGLAEYASLLYLQQAKGDNRYYDKLKEYADEIYSAREYLFFSGKEAGPVILGQRTASTRTEGDYGLIIYRKGALVLHTLRAHLTDWSTRDDSLFFAVLQRFYEDYAGKTASTTDLRRTVEEVTGEPMDWFFHQWIFTNALPEYRFTYDIVETETDTYRADGRVTLEDGPESFKTRIPLAIHYDNGRIVYDAVTVAGAVTEFELSLAERPEKIVMNPNTAVLVRVKQ